MFNPLQHKIYETLNYYVQFTQSLQSKNVHPEREKNIRDIRRLTSAYSDESMLDDKLRKYLYGAEFMTGAQSWYSLRRKRNSQLRDQLIEVLDGHLYAQAQQQQQQMQTAYYLHAVGSAGFDSGALFPSPPQMRPMPQSRAQTTLQRPPPMISSFIIKD